MGLLRHHKFRVFYHNRKEHRKLARKGFSYEIKEILGDVSPIENITGSYAKGVLRTLMKHHDNDPGEEGIDIRNYNRTLKLANGTGIRLTMQEAHAVCDILVRNGYGSTDVLETELKRRKSLYQNQDSNEPVD